MNAQSHRSNPVIPESNTCNAHHDVLACQQAAEPPPLEVLNLKDLYNRCMGNANLVQRVLQKFQQRIPQELAELEKALELGDTEQIARVAHRVKGSSANVSAKNLVQAAAEIEDLSRAGRVTDIPVRIEHLHDEWENYLGYAVLLLSAGDAV